MASLRSGYGLLARPHEGVSTRRPSEPGQPSAIPRQMPRPDRADVEASIKASVHPPSQSRLPSRVPQPTSAPRQAPRPQAARRPMPDHQAASWGSTSTTESSQFTSHTQSGSGSSTSSRSHEAAVAQGRNVLRRKKSTISQKAAAPRKATTTLGVMPSIPRPRTATETVPDLQAERYLTESPPVAYELESPKRSQGLSQPPIIYPELDRYRGHGQQATSSTHYQTFEIPHKLSTHNLPPPTPASLPFSGSSSQLSASPSTKFSASPGPGPYSRDTTPTSISSHSPGQPAIAKFNAPKGRQLSPALARPPVTRRRAGSTPNEAEARSVDPDGLAAVRESLNSSSSSSTVKDGDRGLKEKKGSKAARRLPPPPPSPPPRKSSQKFRNVDDETRSLTSGKTKARSKSAGAASQERKPLSPESRPLASPGRATTPRRPSREGTPNIPFEYLNAAPIVHSNLSSASLPGERRGSESDDLGASYDRGRNTSTSQIPIGRDGANHTRPSTSTTLGIPEPTRPSRTPSPAAGSFHFPFFGRRKPDQQSPPKAKADSREKRLVRKGPAAGTGHEGYGRFGAVRRRSGSNNLSRGFSDNQDSQESLVSNDSFFSDRQAPVIISGGEIVENCNSSSEPGRAESDHGSPLMWHNSGPRTTPPQSRTTVWPSPVIPPSVSGSRRPSDSSDSEAPDLKSSLALGTSVQRLREAPEDPLHVLEPTSTEQVASSPMTSFDTSSISEESHLELQKELSRERSTPHSAPRKLTKRERSPRRWNLFGKSSKHQEPEKNKAVTPPEQHGRKRAMAFYTIMDTSEQNLDLDQEADIQEVLRSADVDLPTSNQSTPDLQASGFQTPELKGPFKGAPPPLSQKVYHDPPSEGVPGSESQKGPRDAESTMGAERPSRLQQVGRIPKVVSHRDEHESPRSFSRPFRASMQSIPQAAQHLDPDSIGKGPSPPNASGPAPDAALHDLAGQNPVAGGKTTVESPDGMESDEFIRFSPRKSSDGTARTSSSSGRYPYTHATAVIPGPDDPPAEDEVWDEYDDLIEASSAKAPLSATSSKGTPFHLETYQSKLAKEKPMESPTLATDRVTSTLSGPTASSCYSADFTERIRNAFQPHPSPLSPQFPPGADEDPQETTTATTTTDTATQETERGASIPAAALPRRSLSPIKERDSGSSYGSSEDGSPLSQVNLRVGSMTVSKWLTFGHVLFSDVRHDLVLEDGRQERHSILVIDGLGNDDWSFYAAETYPAAAFYNLSPRAPLPPQPEDSSSGFPLTPPNHHQIQYTSHADKFPFAAQSFTSVVYRFAVAAPEAHYRNVLSEARRVLKPGGYLELSILDVDLNNMGSRARRAVRKLKENIHARDADINLASTADLMLRLIGSAGFYEVKAARVGVPVAGPPTTNHGGTTKPEGRTTAGRKREQPSLSELMSDKSSTADESITKMVARVGRWWYARCYESAAEPAAQTSMWNDKALMRECEQLGTSLKLMVCCGRAPDRVSSI